VPRERPNASTGGRRKRFAASAARGSLPSNGRRHAARPATPLRRKRTRRFRASAAIPSINGDFDEFLSARLCGRARGQRSATPGAAKRADVDNACGKRTLADPLWQYLDEETGETGRPLCWTSPLHCVLVGVNGAGKSTRFLTELYATTSRRSLFVFDVKGTAAVQTAELRRRYGDVNTICPYPVHGLKSDGHNPLAGIDPNSKFCYGDCRAVIDAIVDLEEGNHAHWSESASDFGTAGCMFEVKLARRERRTPSLLNVRMMLSEPDKWESDPRNPGHRRLVAGVKLRAARMIKEGGPIIASLVGNFLKEHAGENELASIASTYRRNTSFFLDPHIAEDLAVKDGVDFARLRKEATSVYVVLPPERISENRRWTRLVLSSAMRAHFRTGEFNTLFVLDEFRATVGKLAIVADVWALVREYGMQLMPVVQSLIQLKALYGDEWETFVGQAGALVQLGAPGDLFTADYESKRSGIETVLQRGYNVSDSVNNGKGANSGTSTSNTGPGSNEGSSREYGYNTSGTFTVQQVERPAISPQQLMNMRPGHGRIWVHGMGSRSIPFFAPNYWNRDAAWVRSVKPNPYYRARWR
jgi:hypothetical protein